MADAPLQTTAQAARAIGVSRRTLSRYAEHGMLTPTLTLPSGHHRWDLDDVRRQLREHHLDDVERALDE